MRIRIVFKLNNRGGCVPFHHQALLARLFEEWIDVPNSPYQDYQLYNFSGLKGQTKISRQGLHYYSSRITLVVASPNTTFLEYLVRQIFTHHPSITIGGLHLSPEMVEQEEMPQFSEEMKYICISPIVITDAQDDLYAAKKFISPEQDVFSDLLYDTTMARLEALGDYSEAQMAKFNRFQLVPDRIYLKRIKEDNKKFARIYALHTTLQHQMPREVRGYTLPFILYAAPEVQRFVYQCGLGAYTHHGYGMVDVADVHPPRRTIFWGDTGNDPAKV